MARRRQSDAAGLPRRWWLQLLLPVAAYSLVGVAAMLTSLLEDLLR